MIVHGRFSGFQAVSGIAADILRVKHGLFVERWDVIQDEATQETSKSVSAHVRQRISHTGLKAYVPVTVLVDERPDDVHLSYDTMASFLAPYGNSDALAVARNLSQFQRSQSALFLYFALSGRLFSFSLSILIQVQGYTLAQAAAALLPFILLMFLLSRWSGTSFNIQNTARHLGWRRIRLNSSGSSFSRFSSLGRFGVPARGQPFDSLRSDTIDCSPLPRHSLNASLVARR